MTLRLFGAGGAFSRRYGTTCSMVTLGSGERWLIDCGRQAPEQLYHAGIVWHDITGQIVTHVHGDHVYGLEDFAFIRYFESRGGDLASSLGGSRPKLVGHSAVIAEVWETLAPSLRYLNDGNGNLQSGTLRHFFEIIDARASEPPAANPWPHSEHFTTGALDVICRESMHVPGKPSCSSSSASPHSDRNAWWSGDSIVDADLLIALEPRTSVFFHDCTFVDYPGQVHGFFERAFAAGRAVAEAPCKRPFRPPVEIPVENQRGYLASGKAGGRWAARFVVFCRLTCTGTNMIWP